MVLFMQDIVEMYKIQGYLKFTTLNPIMSATLDFGRASFKIVPQCLLIENV